MLGYSAISFHKWNTLRKPTPLTKQNRTPGEPGFPGTHRPPSRGPPSRGNLTSLLGHGLGAPVFVLFKWKSTCTLVSLGGWDLFVLLC